MNENDLLSRLPALFRTDDPSVVLGCGPDDCGHVRVGKSGALLSVSTDAFAEGSHFPAGANPRDVARKCLAASLSDLAASACLPRWATASLCLRPGLPPDWGGEFACGLAAAAKRHGVTVIGGDTISSRNGLFVSMTVMGEPLPGGPVFRNGARPGDVLVVTGELGGSILGRHLDPAPRLGEMAALMEFAARRTGAPVFPSAAMDISDGLAMDLSRLCRESGVGAALEEALIPISRDARRLAERDGGSPVEHALSDGEDFELLIAMDPALWRDFQAFLAGRGGGAGGLARFSRVGKITGDASLVVEKPTGVRVPLAARGYEHTW